MAHNLATHIAEDGSVQHSAYSYRKSMWHALGTVVQEPLADAAIQRIAGLNWAATKVNMRTDDADLAPVPGYQAIRRSDNGQILGIVGEDYQVFQNEDLFSVLRGIANGTDTVIETAGALGLGETVWVQIHLPKLEIVLGDDVSRTYLLATTGHIGNRRLSIMPTAVRVVCQNTLNMALGRGRNKNTLATGYSIRHTSGMLTAVRDAASAYANALESHAYTADLFRFLAAKPMTEADVKLAIDSVFQVDGAEQSDRARAISANREQTIREILASPTSRVRGTSGSMFALYNAFGEFVDHRRTTRTSDGGDSTDAARFESSLFGSGFKVKQQAWDVVLGLAGAVV